MISCQTQTTAKEDIFISKENRVILTNEKYLATQYELWTPTQEHIAEALTVIITFLQNAELNNSLDEYFKSEIEKIIDNCDKYRVQFVGIIENEKKYIHCNFIPNNNDFSNWKEQLIMVDDGGFWFWQVYYDVQLKKVIKIYINGYA